jgi:hypothetical protein
MMRLVQLVSGAFAVAVLWAASAQAFVCIRVDDADQNSPCVRWFNNAATVRSLLGAPPRSPLLNGTQTWDQNTILAADDWNAENSPFQFGVQIGGQFNNPCGARGANHACDNTGPSGDNPIFFASDFCGRDFRDIIELTNNCYRSDNGQLINAPVFVNSNVLWNAYDGPTRFDNSSTQPIPVYDIRRVLLHELGHVLGLGHPDEAGQNVVAIMNSRVSSLDRLQADDTAGLRSQYGGTAPNQPAPSSGCAIGSAPDQARWAVAGALLWLLIMRLRRRVVTADLKR